MTATQNYSGGWNPGMGYGVLNTKMLVGAFDHEQENPREQNTENGLQDQSQTLKTDTGEPVMPLGY